MSAIKPAQAKSYENARKTSHLISSFSRGGDSLQYYNGMVFQEILVKGTPPLKVGGTIVPLQLQLTSYAWNWSVSYIFWHFLGVKLTNYREISVIVVV